MLEMLVMHLDEDGIPRAYASGLVESNKDLDQVKNTALKMLSKYIESKGCSRMRINSFTQQIEIVDQIE